jgi:hypothetical protein
MYSVLNYIKATSSRPRESSRLIKPFQISSNVFKNFTTFADATVQYSVFRRAGSGLSFAFDLALIISYMLCCN